MMLLKCCYFTPAVESFFTPALTLYNLYGRMGLRWARKRIKI
jgi:hypothetical protein